MVPSSPPSNKKETNYQRSDQNPLTDKIDHFSHFDFYCLRLRVGLFVSFFFMYCVPLHLDFVHEKAKPKAAA